MPALQQVVQVTVPMNLLAVVLVISPAAFSGGSCQLETESPGSSMDAVRLPEQLQLWCT
jgi:hypothetical protein